MPSLRVIAALLLLLMVAMLAVEPAAWAQEQNDAAYAAQVQGWQKILDKASSSLLRPNLSEADHETIRKALTDVFDQARKASAEAADTVSTSRPMIEALGKPPAEGAPEEAGPVAAERERLSSLVTRFDGRVHQADLVATRADILLRTANERRINQFTETLFLRGVSPLASETFRQLPVEAQFVRDRILTAVNAVITAGLPRHEQGVTFGILAGLAVVVGWLLRRFLMRRFGQRDNLPAPSYRQRVIAAAAEALARGLIPCLLIAAAASTALDALTGLAPVSVLVAMIRSLAGLGIAFFLVAGLGRALLAVRRPAWRLFGIGDRAARLLALACLPVVFLLSLSGAVLAFLEVALVPPSLHAVASFGAKLLGAAALLAIVVPDRIWKAGDERAVALVPGLRALAALIALAVVVAGGLRYHNLGVYVAEMSLAGAAVAGLLLVVRGIGRELIDQLMQPQRPGLLRLRQALFHSDQDVRVFQFLAAGCLDLLLLALGFAMLLPLSGIAWSEVMAWGTLFLRGVKIGEVMLSPVDIASALMLVVVIMGITRFIQRKLDDQVLQNLPIDRGVRHSIRTGIGYAGALIAILIGVGTLGLSLSNLALIAGALSVGIGFGLQAIVSNFVAGLILLVERPVKVGDWIVIGEHEGVVKRISVRATEIQTFQHASVIVPNSELITRAVKNWTYKDKFGRIDIQVGIACEADPELARDLLLACASNDRRVTDQPAPSVVFRDFGDSSLDLELRCFISDVDSYRAVATDLRFAILKTLREHNIELPYPQRVVHSPELARIAALMARAQETTA